MTTGKIEDGGRIWAAALGGAVAGVIIGLNPAVGIASVMAYGAAAGGAAGVTERLINSGGKSAGTVTDVLVDQAVGAVTAGLLKGGSVVVRKAVTTIRAPTAAAVAKAAGSAAEGTFSPIVGGGGLGAHEAAGGHLLARHVGQAESALATRLATDGNPHPGGFYVYWAGRGGSCSLGCHEPTLLRYRVLGGLRCPRDARLRRSFQRRVRAIARKCRHRAGQCCSRCPPRRQCRWLLHPDRVPVAMSKDQLSLKNFMSAYFHEDWTLDGESAHDIVANFVRDRDPHELSAVIHALRELLNAGEDDASLSRRLFAEFGAYFDPPSIGQSTSSWLNSVADQIELALGNRE